MLFATLGVLLTLAQPNPANVCDRYKSADLIFTGTAEDKWIDMLDTHKSPMHKRSEKSKRVRFLVREWFKGERQNMVEVYITPSNCPFQSEANQTYLIYARLNKDDGRIETNACMGTTLVSNAAPDLTYLTAASQAQGTQITGNAGKDNLTVVAKSGMDTRYASTDAKGNFAFTALPPGDWSLNVVGSAPSTVHLSPDSCVSVDLH